MYPKNNATPPAIDLGQILLLADGTIQTTGASVRVRIGTGAWGAGAGTLACDTTSGIWTYAPTQAETNAEYFIVAAYKADCSALSKTVITSDSSVSGRVNVQTLQTDVITAAAFATSAVDEIVDAVYDEPMSGHTVNGSYGSHLVRSANQNQNTVQITGSQHIAADMHESQVGAIHTTTFDAGAITSAVLATDSITSSQIAASAVTEIQAGLASQSSVNTLTTYVDTEVAAIKVKTDNLPSDPADASDITAAFTEIKGATWSSSTDTLEKIRDAVDSSGGGGDSIIVTPIVAQTPVRTVATNISTFKGDRSAITVGVFDELDPVDLTALGALEVCIQTKAGTDLQVIAAANITISGADNNYFSFSPGSAAVATVGRFMWSLRVAASNSKRVIAYGAWIVEDAALNDA